MQHLFLFGFIKKSEFKVFQNYILAILRGSIVPQRQWDKPRW